MSGDVFAIDLSIEAILDLARSIEAANDLSLSVASKFVNRHSTMTHYPRPTVTPLQEGGTGGEESEILFFSAKWKRQSSLSYSMQIIPVCLSIVARRKGVSTTRGGGSNWTPISLLVGHPCKLFHTKFVGSSRFIGEMSDTFVAEEKRRSVPWVLLHRWLDRVDSIDMALLFTRREANRTGIARNWFTYPRLCISVELRIPQCAPFSLEIGSAVKSRRSLRIACAYFTHYHKSQESTEIYDHGTDERRCLISTWL